MVARCVVKGCGNKGGQIKLHIFPKEKEKFYEWAVAIGKPNLSYEKRSYIRICDKHFSEFDRFPFYKNRTNLKKTATPTLFLPSTSIEVNSNNNKNDGSAVKMPISNTSGPVDISKAASFEVKRTAVDKIEIVSKAHRNNDSVIEIVENSDPLGITAKDPLDILMNNEDPLEVNAPSFIKILKPVTKPNLNIKLKPVTEKCIFVPLNIPPSSPDSVTTAPVSTPAPIKVPSPTPVSSKVTAPHSDPFPVCSRTKLVATSKRGLIKGYTTLPARTSSTNLQIQPPVLQPKSEKSIDIKLDQMTYVRNLEGQYVKKVIVKSLPKQRKKELIVPLQKLPIKNVRQRIPLKNITIFKKPMSRVKTITVTKGKQQKQTIVAVKKNFTVTIPKQSTSVLPASSLIDLTKSRNLLDTFAENKNIDPQTLNSDRASSVTEAGVQTDVVGRRTTSIQTVDKPIDMDTEGILLASTIRKLELKIMCRICFSKDNLVDVYQAEYENMKLWQIIYELTNQRIGSRGPRCICQSCMDTVIQAYKFQNVFKRASVIVQQILSKNEDFHIITTNLDSVEERKRDVIADDEDNDVKVTEIPSDDHDYPSKEVVITAPQQAKKRVQESKDQVYLGLLQCQICGFRVEKSLNVIDRHYADQHAVKLSLNMKTGECLACKVHIDRFKLREHFDTDEHKTNCQLCPLCFESQPTKKLLKMHMSKEHDVVGGKIKELRKDYPCILCKVRFTTFQEVDEHFDRYHPKTSSCIICGGACKWTLMKYHMLTHLPNGLMLCCRICRISFDSPQDLEAHNQSEAHSLCKVCNMEFKDTVSYIRHMQRHKEVSLMCELCGQIFACQYNLRRHMDIHNQKVYYCEKCPKKFKNSMCLNSHRRRHELVCPICEVVFEVEWKLILHKARHNLPTAVICPVPKCHQTYANKEELNAHLTESHEAYTCSVCDKKFYTKNTFTGHKSIHLWQSTPDVDDPKTCKLCKKSFNSETLKRMHVMHMHQVYICGECQELFPNSGKLKMHQMHTHNMVMDRQLRVNTKALKSGSVYTCQICKKHLFSYSGYIMHKRRHAGIKPHSCNYCDKRFVNNFSKEMHERTHTGDKRFACSICGKRFIQPGDRNKHQQRHLQEIPAKRRRRNVEYEEDVKIKEDDHGFDASALEEFFQKQGVGLEEGASVSYY